MKQYIPLGDLLESSDSGVWGDEDPAAGISVLRSTNFNADGTLDLTKLTFRKLDARDQSRKLLQAGDILLEKSGGGPKQPVGRVCLFLGDAAPHAFGNFIARLRAGKAVLSQYLFYYLWQFHSSGKTSHYQKQTTGIRNLEFRRYLTILVPVCSIEDQRRIVDQLSRAEGIVRMRRQAQQKAAKLIPALFIDMFGDPATNPKGLDVVSLGDVLASADYGSSSKASDVDVGLPMIRMGNVDYSGNVDLSALKYVDLPPEDAVRFGLKDGDILFNRTNSKELVGKTGLWIGERQAVIASYFIRLRVAEQMVRPFFVWAFMNTPQMKRVLFETARGAIGQANINSRELRAFRIPLPSLDEQVRFESRCRDVLALRSQQGHAMAKADAAFQALLAQAFTVSSQPAFDREEATT